MNAKHQYGNEYVALKGTRDNWPSHVRNLCQSGWDKFAQIGFPTARRGSELWKYTNVNPIADSEFSYTKTLPAAQKELAADIPQDAEWTTIVLVDGHYSKDLSDAPTQSGIAVWDIKTACRETPELLERHLGRYANDLDNAFIALNTAFINSGVVVKVDAGTAAKKPLQIVYLSSQSELERVSFPRVLVLLGENSECTLLETYWNQNPARNLMVGVGEIFMDAGSQLQHYRAQLDAPSSYHISHTRIYQSQNTRLNSVSLARGSAIGRYDIRSELAEVRSECEMYGLYLTTGEQHQSNEISTTHSKPNSTSRQIFKGILSGKSQAVFSGKVTVKEGALKTDAQQKDLNLLLSRGAEIDTKPSLEIYADDVKCGHGATAGHLDKMTLFYLQSRGLTLEQAMAMQAFGFASDIVDRVNDPQIAQFFEKVINSELPKLLADSDLLS